MPLNFAGIALMAMFKRIVDRSQKRSPISWIVVGNESTRMRRGDKA
jgi:hypothetical protein